MIEVLQPGLLTTVQDGGRKGYEAYGMPPSGPFDPFLASVANKLAGNPLHSALLEFALVGPSLKMLQPMWVAIAAHSCTYLLNGQRVSEFSAFPVPAGSVLQFTGMSGWFGYLAIAGGIEAETTLGSASSYLAGRIGKKLERGMKLRIGRDAGKHYSIRAELLSLHKDENLFILPALHTFHFYARDRQKLVEDEYKVSIQSNRMGIHLRGPAVISPHARHSAPALPGTIQVPRARQPIILGPEGPTTGGYPQIAILSRVSWTRLAQTRPGEVVRFEWIDVQRATQIRRYRDQIFAREDAWQNL